jgi:hypothetical protein
MDGEDYRFIDANGYPEMIDPATGLEWGINPSTGELYDGLTWPAEEPDDPDARYNPLHDTDQDYGENPATPGFNYGIDPSTGNSWHNYIIDNTGEVTNPLCEDPENTYRPAGSEECV